MTCTKCGTQLPVGTSVCPVCGCSLAPAHVTDWKPTRSMKWHNYLCYFGLWAGALFNIVSAFIFFTGAQYTIDGRNYSEFVYAVFPKMKIADMLYGILVLALAVFNVLTALKLMKFKVGAPRMLTAVYIFSLASAIFYILIAIDATSDAHNSISLGDLVGSSISNTITSVIMIFVNKAYYAKREYMFVD